MSIDYHDKLSINGLFMNLMGSFPSFVEGELESHRGNKTYVFKKQSMQREEKSVHTHTSLQERQRGL